MGDDAVRLIFAGWLPQDGLFGWNSPLVYESGVATGAAHSYDAGSFLALRPSWCTGRTSVGAGAGYSSMASDQHQPASSRAIATLAMTGRFLRAWNSSQRSWSRRLPSCPRTRAAGGALSQRARIALLGVR